MAVPRITGDGTTTVGGVTVNTPYDNDKNQGVKVEDFLNLMIAQMTNQDFMNPADDTQYITQMAQFATMQSMQQLSAYSQTNYVTGMVGKNVTVATLGLGGEVAAESGLVTSVDLSGEEPTVTVNGKVYKLNQIMKVSTADSAVSLTDIAGAEKMIPILMEKDATGMKLRWDAPTADAEKQSLLRYDVYYTENGQLDLTNLANVKRGTLAGENLSDTQLDITGLTSGKTYFVSVVVRNTAGDAAVYQTQTVPIGT